MPGPTYLFAGMIPTLLSSALLLMTTASGSITIPLEKQYVPVMRKGRVVMHKTAYFGTLYIGRPSVQSFTVVFDTGSAHLFVPSSRCASEPCLAKNVYRRELSQSAVDIDQDGQPVANPDEDGRDEAAIAYGTGEIEGGFVRDFVCLTADSTSEEHCTRTRVIIATQMSPAPFSEFKFDGVLGLGLESLALHPEFSFFGQAVQQHASMEPRFGVFLANNDGVRSEITLGGHDARRMAGELQWAEVVEPEQGHWMLGIRSVRIVGGTGGINETLDLCESGDCRAIADTGTSLLGAPRQIVQHLNFLLARAVAGDHERLDCREQAGPDLVIDVGGVELRLGPEDYSRPAGLRVVDNTTQEVQFVCRAQLLPVDDVAPLGPKAWILGEPILKKYYSVFDWSAKRVGFALATAGAPVTYNASASGRVEEAAASGVVHGVPSEDALRPTVVHV